MASDNTKWVRIGRTGGDFIGWDKCPPSNAGANRYHGDDRRRSAR
jgi:hypothetical protein